MLALKLNQCLHNEQKYFRAAYNWIGFGVFLGLFYLIPSMIQRGFEPSVRKNFWSVDRQIGR